MLCEACLAHFRYDKTKRNELLHLKKEGISLLKQVLGDDPLIVRVESDCYRYEEALRRYYADDEQNSPWYTGDLSWLPEEIENEKYEIEIWRDRPEEQVRQSIASGCDICTRLIAIISYMPKFEPSDSFDVTTYLEMNAISLKPTRIRYLVQARLESEHEWCHLQLINVYSLKGAVNCRAMSCVTIVC
jgi:hypothetical protein